MLSGSLVRLMNSLLDQKDLLIDWKVPKEWTDLKCRPLEFEEYLKSKWSTDLGPLVLSMPLDQIGWWNYKATPKQFDCFAKQLVRVPDLPWEPIDRLPVLEFLLPEDNPADFFYKTFHEVIF
jgi:hypothetical protein